MSRAAQRERRRRRRIAALLFDYYETRSPLPEFAPPHETDLLFLSSWQMRAVETAKTAAAICIEIGLEDPSPESLVAALRAHFAVPVEPLPARWQRIVDAVANLAAARVAPQEARIRRRVRRACLNH